MPIQFLFELFEAVWAVHCLGDDTNIRPSVAIEHDVAKQVERVGLVLSHRLNSVGESTLLVRYLHNFIQYSQATLHHLISQGNDFARWVIKAEVDRSIQLCVFIED